MEKTLPVKVLGGLRPLGPPTMGLRPPMVNLPHESWDKPTIGGWRPVMGGPRGRSPPSIFTGKILSIHSAELGGVALAGAGLAGRQGGGFARMGEM